MSYASDALIDAQEREIKKLKAENAKLRKFANLDTEDIDTMSCLVDDLKSENASLKGAVQGLGALCDQYKAENERLRACLGDNCADCAVGMGEYADSLCDPIKVENAKLRELTRKSWHILMSERCTLDGVRAYDSMSMDPEEYLKAIDTEIDKIRARMQDFGIEVK